MRRRTQIKACPASDAGSSMAAVLTAYDVIGGEFPFSIAGCEARISGCGANDLAKLNNELSCIQQLKPFDCSILGEDPDAGLAQFASNVAVCEPQTPLSVTCQAVDGGIGCGQELHTNTNENNPLPLGFQTAIPDCLGVIDGIPDTHYLSLTAPSTPAAGGYFTVTFSNISQNVQGQLAVSLADSNGNQLNMASYSFSNSSALFLAAAANSKFLVEVSSDSQIPLGYVVLAQYTGIDDNYKSPMGDSQVSAAKSIPLNSTTMNSYYWAGQRNAAVLNPEFNGDFDDWFSFGLTQGGTVSLKLEQFPYDFAPEVDFVDQAGTVILPQPPNPSKSDNEGTPISYSALAPTGGTYYAHVFAYQVGSTYATYSTAPLSSSPILPPHFLQPYVLTVTFSQ